MGNEIALRIIDAAARSARPYAVFGGRHVEFMPADGKRFAKLQRDPLRMVYFAGVFDDDSSPEDISEAIDTVIGA